MQHPPAYALRHRLSPVCRGDKASRIAVALHATDALALANPAPEQLVLLALEHEEFSTFAGREPDDTVPSTYRPAATDIPRNLAPACRRTETAGGVSTGGVAPGQLPRLAAGYEEYLAAADG
ncbi:hypothetical protein HYPSUDRAFT_209999 [Hypholoma sublateritium FD-334 SS-4]|uniref:Uncharacterized protein n=1 Tax=Hypholoma sublateritium (strain FD-334 SS-4) TaxID=945553 RepID=A0A0D2LQ20_HYPSF|nr:hypothetical protein HYPSUDRAFT_209999 [Hypholoma sublateritium FD-334 SS-4]